MTVTSAGGAGGLTETDRLDRYGPWVGAILPFFFAPMWILAVIVNGNWTLGGDTLSELGGQVPSRWIFNSAVMISGAMGVVFSIALYRRLRSKPFGKAGGVIMAIASICLISVGVFPIDTGTPHTIASVAFFGLAAISALVLELPISRCVGIAGIPSLVTISILAISFICLALTPLPFAEAVATSGLMVWVLSMSVWMKRDAER